MAGSVANPVSLDPFRTITEVHWNNVTHICFRLAIDADIYWTNEFEVCYVEVDPPSSLPDSSMSNTYITRIEYAVSGSGPAGFYSRSSNGTWTSRTDVSVSGTPDLSSSAVDFSAWQYDHLGLLSDDSAYVGTTPRTFPDEDLLHFKINNSSSVTFQALSGGTDTGIAIPDGGGNFLSGVTPQFGVKALGTFASADPVCLIGLGFPVARDTWRLLNRDFPLIATNNINPGSFTATWRGRSFVGIAAYIDFSTIEGYSLSSDVVILCQKVSS